VPANRSAHWIPLTFSGSDVAEDVFEIRGEGLGGSRLYS
jgi:hypothetical protein